MDNHYNIYIVEDEAITRATLKRKLVKLGFRVVGMADDAEIAWKEIQKLDIDLVLLDIQLIGEKDGIWLGLQIQNELQIPFIFLTAYSDEKTINLAIDVRPQAYLTKPFDETDLYTTVSLGIRNFQKNQISKKSEESISPEKGRIFIKDENLLIKLQMQDLLYVMSEGNYLELVLPQKKHLIRKKLADFLDELPDDDFIRVHQRYIININKLSAIGSGFVNIEGTEIPVSGTYKIALMERITTW